MADAIRVHCRPLEETRGPNSSCEWLAECEVDGRRFAVRSRHGVVYELARMLVTARIDDRPLSVTFAGVASPMTKPSPRRARRSCEASPRTSDSSICSRDRRLCSQRT
jgi:hypothetical protein